MQKTCSNFVRFACGSSIAGLRWEYVFIDGRKLLVYPILFQMTRGSFSFQIYCSRPNGSQVMTQNVPKIGDIWGSAWLLVIMNGPINQKLK